MLRRVSTIAIAATVAISGGLIAASPALAAPPKYKNCAAVQKASPLGMGVKRAKDKVKSTTEHSKVTKFKAIGSATYNANKKLDTDKDKILCESVKYKNCKAANKVYPHGAGLKGAKDKVAGNTDPVTTFKVVSNAIFETNKANLDRDKDKIFCEKL